MHIIYLTFLAPQELRREEQTKSPASGRKEIINTREEINEIENTKTIKKIKTKQCLLFKMNNKIDRPLAELTKVGVWWREHSLLKL